MGGTNIITSIGTKRNTIDSYSKTETDGLVNNKIGFAYDPLLLIYLEIDTIRPKTTGQAIPNVKFDCSIAVVGNVNIAGSSILKLNGLDIVTTLNGKNATLTSATAVGAQPI